MSEVKEKSLNVTKVIDYFNLRIINQDNPNLQYNDIYQPTIKRVGLELSELIVTERIYKNVVAWGTSESMWFFSIGKQRATKAIEHIFSQLPPLVLLSKGFQKPALSWVYEIANKYNIPVALSRKSSSIMTTNVGTYLNDFFAEETQVHGTLVLVGAIGVLIIGQSGVGKSEAALELVQRGNILISDDAVLIKDAGIHFIGRCPSITRNFLEVRGIGIIDVKYTYGVSSMSESANIDLVIELVKFNRANSYDRLGTELLTHNILGRTVRKMVVPIKEGGSAASLIEAAVSFYMAQKDGKNILKEIENRRY
ncbi:HPr(Ser) kinase/phosphatase [Mycoplasma corogypsi]|uniref:HPr(Ser) kinase/phosphatase n=1 Tax=Mycoplasma corogypsi TaxID=2106 RepID=UPI003873420E